MFLDIDRHSADSLAAKDDSGGTVSYSEIVTLSEQMAKVLTARELVFCLCENEVGALAGYVGLYQNRDVPLLLDGSIDTVMLNNLIETYTPSYIWTSRDIAGCTEIMNFKGYKLLRIPHKSPEMNDNLSLLLTTSGSTGSPKMVRHRYGNIEYNAKAVADVFGWTVFERGICQLPMHYTMGLNVINSLLCSGAVVLLCKNNLMTREFWSFIKTEKGTSFTGVPYSYEIMLKMKLTKMDLPYLKIFASGGGKLSEENFRKLVEYCRETDRKFYSTFGTTETSARLAYLPPELACSKICSIGSSFPGGEMVLIDKDGSIITDAEAEGELLYRGENVTMGYAQNREELQLGDEWRGEYRTGDIARRDADGCYFIIGRISRFLKLFGHRVSLDYCEKLITDKFAVSNVCAGTDKKMAVFVINNEILQEVSDYLVEKTGLPKTAFRVSYIEEIPRKASGKPDYQKLI